jgi:2,4-dienoyl-CoA reductase-like NADH-dependent reductase (Old Yellow Enzyme family)
VEPRERLAAPLVLPCGATLPNRLAKSAMSEQLGDRAHAPGPELRTLYAAWSAGGAGLLVTGNVMIDRTALGEARNVVFDAASDVGAIAPWARAATAAGNHAWVQLNHPGRQAPRSLAPEPVAPSAVRVAVGAGVFAMPRALTGAEIEDLIARFAHGARVAKEAGFTGVQVHGAHGYLVSQFLSPRTNLRTDAWGGTPERRRRFLLEVVAAIRAAVGPGFPVGVKLNSADFQRGGFDEAESMEVVLALEAAGIDLLEISGGSYEAPAMMGEARKASTVAREAYFLDYAREVRTRTRLPLMLTGGFRTAAGMAAALAEGAVDLVGLARPLAVEPDLPARLLAGTAAGAAPTRDLRVGAYDAFIDLTWHAQQLDRLGRGLAPDPGRSPWLALGIGLVDQGWSALWPKRG